MMTELHGTIGQYTPDNLIAGHKFPMMLKGITLAKNQGVVKRGTVLGKVTASGLCKPVDNAAADGTENPYIILTDDIDTGDGSATEDFLAEGYLTGVFNRDALIFGGDDTYSDHEDKLRELGIFLREVK
ncbi:MAG: head decoration protein [Firmicutes bacterium]|nr:head decoration protein [Bacillota bacterium]